jgi:excisionase family DNA binding protein
VSAFPVMLFAMKNDGLELITLDEAARRLGLQPSTLRAWRLARRIPVIKVGVRAVRVDAQVVRDLIDRGRVPARHSLEVV